MENNRNSKMAALGFRIKELLFKSLTFYEKISTINQPVVSISVKFSFCDEV